MKKLTTIVLCLLMVAALAVTVFAANGAKFSMTPATKTLERGQQVTLNVSLSNTNVATSYGLKLEYDADVFEVVSGSTSRNVKELLLDEVLATGSFNASRGFALMYYSGKEAAFSGDVGTVTFKVKDNAPMGTYTITGVASVKNGSQTVTAENATATITVSCSHTYGSWTQGNADGHQRTCTKCGNVETKAHTWNSGTTTKAATCTEDGVKTFTCSTCKATKTEAIAKLGHKEGAATQTKAPTCTETGTKTVKCTRCSSVLKTETVPALGHKEGTGKVTTAATCTADGVKSFSCTRSGCGQVVRTETIPALGHKEDKGTVTKEATCKEDGVKTFKCTVCKTVTRTEVISKNDAHKFGNLVYVDENGHKDVCSICNQELTLEHKWDAGKVTQKETCKDTGIKTYTCTGCKGTKTEVIPVNENHKFDSAEYVDADKHNAICSVCEKAVAEDHAWDKGVETKKPTCQEDGEKTYTCATCKGTKVEVITASEEYHVPGEWIVTVQPTYESAGSREADCTICGEKIVEELPAIAVPPTGDNSKIILWSAVLVLSACGLFATIFLLNDQKRKQDR